MSGLIVTCSIFNGDIVAGGDQLSVELDGVVNPSSAATTYTVSVSTTSDHASSVASNQYTVNTAQSVSGVGVTRADAASAPTTYLTTFTTSSTGGLSGVAAGKLTINFPSGTDLGGLTNGGVVRDLTTSGHPQVGGGCTVSGLIVTCSIFNGDIVAGGDQLGRARRGAQPF